MPTLNTECDKAAHILKGFVERHKIPSEVVANAKGIAIFSGFRAAMWLAGTSGSGVVVARQPDGSWSAPSAFSVLSGGIGVALGADVFDCVCVLNTKEAIDAYTLSEVKLGADVSVAAGPVGGAADVSARDVKPVWTYVKSRGLYGAVAVDGTVLRERTDVNAKGYGTQFKAAQILSGEVPWPSSSHLREVLRAAEGKRANAQILGAVSSDPAPGDLAE